jgi:DNA-directed RNA polymerase specialized sigma24 family protein
MPTIRFQAACERALARHFQFQEGTRFDSWMFRIVQTIWIDQVRSRDVRKGRAISPRSGWVRMSLCAASKHALASPRCGARSIASRRISERLCCS